MSRVRRVCRITLAAGASVFLAAAPAWAPPDYVLEQKLILGTGNDAHMDLGSHQGTSIAISRNGKRVLSGAPNWGRNTVGQGRGIQASGAGVVWDSTGVEKEKVWTSTVLIPTGLSPNAQAGSAVALDADGITALLGAPEDSNSQGTVVIMVLENGDWVQKGTLVPNPRPDPSSCFEQRCRFGSSVAISGDGETAIVGSQYANYSPAQDISNGGVWIFKRSGNSWTQTTTRDPTNAVGPAFLGYSVDVNNNGTVVIVGGIGDNQGNGAAWIFTYGNIGTVTVPLNGYAQKAKLLAPAPAGAQQGYSVAISSDGLAAMVGAPAAPTTGSAYRFTTTDNWATYETVQLAASLDLPAKMVGVWAPGQGASLDIAEFNATVGYRMVTGGSVADSTVAGATWVWEKEGTRYAWKKLPRPGIAMLPNIPGFPRDTLTLPLGRKVAISGNGNVILSADGTQGEGVLLVYRKNE